jgi:hypothetical protein
MEPEEVSPEENAARDGSDRPGSPFDHDAHELTDEQKALLAAWDKTNAPARPGDAQFEARLLAVLNDQLATPQGSHTVRSVRRAELDDVLACAQMAADANAEDTAAAAESHTPILVDAPAPDAPGGGLRRDWKPWVPHVRPDLPSDRDELPFLVRFGDASPVARSADQTPSWDALVHEDPDDPSTLRQKVSKRADDDRWKIARGHTHVAPGHVPGAAADLGHELGPQPPGMVVVLVVAANPRKTSRDRLAQECTAIEQEPNMAPLRDRFRFESRWALTLPELTGHLAELAPTVLHVVGHGGPGGDRASGGLVLQDAQGFTRPVPVHALTRMIDTAARNLRVVVLNACFRRKQAEGLCRRVDCVVGMGGAIDNAAARQFAGELYAALGNRRSVGTAFERGVAALAVARPPSDVQPHCLTRKGVDVRKLHLWDPDPATAAPP